MLPLLCSGFCIFEHLLSLVLSRHMLCMRLWFQKLLLFLAQLCRVSVFYFHILKWTHWYVLSTTSWNPSTHTSFTYSFSLNNIPTSKCISCCCRILRIPTEELQHHFDTQLPESVKELLTYAKNFLEFCSFQALHVVSSHPDYLSDKEFRRMTFDMMLAWESPCVENKALDKVRKLLPVHSFNIIEILCFLIFNQKLHSIAPLSSTFAWRCLLNHLQLQETASSSNQEVEDEDGWSLFYSSSTNMAVQVLLFINFIVFVMCKYHIILILFSHRHRMS